MNAVVRTFWTSTLFLSIVSGHAHSREGLTTDSVTFMQTADLSGTRSALTKELNAGTVAYFKLVNGQGGVFGRKLYLKTFDDGYDADRTRELISEHVRLDDGFAFVSLIGTVNAQAALPLLTAAKIPLIAPLTGAAELREPFNRYVFHVRGSYAQEVEHMVEHVLSIGMTRVAVFYDDDAFGKDVARAVELALQKRNLSPVAMGMVERGSANVSAALRTIAASNPQVVICGSFGKSVIEFVRGMKAVEVKPKFYTLSFFTAGTAIKQLGADARGIGVTQVVPGPNATNINLVREFLGVMAKYSPNDPISYISLEGFLVGKILAEGLRSAGPLLTRENFISGLEGLRNFDLGGLFLNYSNTDHVGLKRIEITVIDRGGKVLR